MKLLPLLVLLLACGDKAEEEDDDDGGGLSDDTSVVDEDDTGGGTSDCGGTAPVLAELSCSNSGMQDNGGTSTPTFTFKTDVTDADGDLESYTMELFYDTEADGALDIATATAFGTSEGTVGGVACEAKETEARVTFFLEGTPGWGETVDFGLVVKDRNSDASEVAVRTCRLPDASGLGGGPI